MKRFIMYFVILFFVIIILNLFCNNSKGSEDLILEENISSSSILTTTTASLTTTLTSTEETTTTLVDDVYIYAAGYFPDRIWGTGSISSFFEITKYNFYGQEDTSGWNKTYLTCGVGWAGGIAIDINNNIYIGGVNYESVDANFGSSNYQSWYIRKFESSGNELASSVCSPFYIYPFSGDVETLHPPACSIMSMDIDVGGNIFATGLTYQKLTGEMECTYRWEIAKFGSNGKNQWVKRFPSHLFNCLSPRLVIDNNSNIYTICNYGVLNGASDWWIKKFDSNGVEDTANWNKLVDSGNDEPQDYYGVDIVASIAKDSQNNIYVFGEGCKLVSNSLNDLWIKKYNSNGVEDTINWNKKFYGGPTKTAYYQVRASSIAVDSKDNVYIVATNDVNNQWVIVRKFTSNGVEIINGWNKNLYFPLQANLWGRAMTIDKYDNIYFAYKDSQNCRFSNYSHIIKFNEFGVQDLSFTVSRCDSIFFNLKAGTR